jgi:FixJ family two-component response regulator
MRSLGYNVEAFSSAADFLASPRLIETTCLIADVHMPAMTGVRHLITRFRQFSLLPTPTTLTAPASAS